jgi:molybdopterin synthase catalytic subunit
VRVLELTYEPLSPGGCLEAVRRAGSGGVVSFIGCVREVAEGKHVDFLEYEAYEPMALAALRQVCDEVSARWPVNAVAIEHRLGRLEIGEDAVVIAVSCPHRAEAFEACRYAIDRLKEIVPIWKKEHGEGGEVWVGGPTAIEAGSSHASEPG